MSYTLENSGEAYRLEKQAQMKGYIPEQELSKIIINPNGKILDAGCGTGLMSRAIKKAYPDANVHACDISEERLRFGRKRASAAGFDEIRFFHSDLQSIDGKRATYDNIVCRYVLQHVMEPQAILKKFHHILNCNGVLNVVEIEGILFNSYCSNTFVMDCLNELQKSFKFDLFIGRKIPAMMKECGFSSINWHVELLEFRGDALQDECILTEERLQFALPLIASILGEEKGSDFVLAYLQELQKPETTLFYNKFIVNGSKK